MIHETPPPTDDDEVGLDNEVLRLARLLYQHVDLSDPREESQMSHSVRQTSLHIDVLERMFEDDGQGLVGAEAMRVLTKQWETADKDKKLATETLKELADWFDSNRERFSFLTDDSRAQKRLANRAESESTQLILRQLKSFVERHATLAATIKQAEIQRIQISAVRREMKSIEKKITLFLRALRSLASTHSKMLRACEASLALEEPSSLARELKKCDDYREAFDLCQRLITQQVLLCNRIQQALDSDFEACAVREDENDILRRRNMELIKIVVGLRTQMRMLSVEKAASSNDQLALVSFDDISLGPEDADLLQPDPVDETNNNTVRNCRHEVELLRDRLQSLEARMIDMRKYNELFHSTMKEYIIFIQALSIEAHAHAAAENTKQRRRGQSRESGNVHRRSFIDRNPSLEIVDPDQTQELAPIVTSKIKAASRSPRPRTNQHDHQSDVLAEFEKEKVALQEELATAKSDCMRERTNDLVMLETLKYRQQQILTEVEIYHGGVQSMIDTRSIAAVVSSIAVIVLRFVGMGEKLKRAIDEFMSVERDKLSEPSRIMLSGLIKRLSLLMDMLYCLEHDVIQRQDRVTVLIREKNSILRDAGEIASWLSQLLMIYDRILGIDGEFADLDSSADHRTFMLSRSSRLSTVELQTEDESAKEKQKFLTWTKAELTDMIEGWRSILRTDDRYDINETLRRIADGPAEVGDVQPVAEGSETEASRSNLNANNNNNNDDSGSSPTTFSCTSPPIEPQPVLLKHNVARQKWIGRSPVPEEDLPRRFIGSLNDFAFLGIQKGSAGDGLASLQLRRKTKAENKDFSVDLGTGRELSRSKEINTQLASGRNDVIDFNEMLMGELVSYNSLPPQRMRSNCSVIQRRRVPMWRNSCIDSDYLRDLRSVADQEENASPLAKAARIFEENDAGYVLRGERLRARSHKLIRKCDLPQFRLLGDLAMRCRYKSEADARRLVAYSKKNDKKRFFSSRRVSNDMTCRQFQIHCLNFQ